MYRPEALNTLLEQVAQYKLNIKTIQEMTGPLDHLRTLRQ